MREPGTRVRLLRGRGVRFITGTVLGADEPGFVRVRLDERVRVPGGFGWGIGAECDTAIVPVYYLFRLPEEDTDA